MRLRTRAWMTIGAASLPLFFLGCSGGKANAPGPQPPVAKAATTPRGNAKPLPTTKGTPKGGTRASPPGLVALREELARAMKVLGSAKPPVHHMGYTVTHHEDE